jgi:DNA recombination protein RmuC
MMKDVKLLGERVRKLQQHFNQSNEDVRQVLISIEKIEKRSDRIAQVELGGGEVEEASNVIAAPVFKLEASNQ